nr:MAG TPA: hypothetical protein [Caudoviricetes sp.]
MTPNGRRESPWSRPARSLKADHNLLGNDLSPRTPATRTTRAMSTRTAV